MPNRKNILLIFVIFSQLIFAATTEQVEKYLLVSNAEEELINLESQFTTMQNNLNKESNNSDDKTYDTQMLTLRFKEYLKKHLSEDEMTQILENYKNMILLEFVSASSEAQNHDRNETISYVRKLKAAPASKTRIKLVNDISKEFYSKESMTIMFDKLMKPLLKKKSLGGKKIDDKIIQKTKEKYLKDMMKTSKIETLYASRDFSFEELEELHEIAKTPSVNYETKAVSGAMAYALKEFFMTLPSHNKGNKHQSENIN